MASRRGWVVVALAGSLAGCATTPKERATAFIVRTTPAGATVETTAGFRCTTPCQVPIGPTAFVATVSSVGYKPVQVPVAAGRDPGTVDIKLAPQDPGANAPAPVKAQ